MTQFEFIDPRFAPTNSRASIHKNTGRLVFNSCASIDFGIESDREFLVASGPKSRTFYLLNPEVNPDFPTATVKKTGRYHFLNFRYLLQRLGIGIGKNIKVSMEKTTVSGVDAILLTLE